MKDWDKWTPLYKTCRAIRCKYFNIDGCKHPNSEYCINLSLYWPWQLDYDNMEVLIKKRNEIKNVAK